MAPSNTRSERIASRNGVSRRVGLIRLCYRVTWGLRQMTCAACAPRCRHRLEGTQQLSCLGDMRLTTPTSTPGPSAGPAGQHSRVLAAVDDEWPLTST